MGRKKRKKRNLSFTNSTLDGSRIKGLKTAANLATNILEICQKFRQNQRTEEQDISLATILTIQFWQQLSEGQGKS